MNRKTTGAARPRQIPRSIQSFELRDAPGHLLRRCHQRSEELFTAAIGTDGPTRQQVALLLTVCQHPEASQAKLVVLTGIDKNTLTQMIRRLTDRGLLERTSSTVDARTNSISATPKAIEMLVEVLPKVRQVQQRILEPVPPELRDAFQHCLRLLVGLDGAEEAARRS